MKLVVSTGALLLAIVASPYLAVAQPTKPPPTGPGTPTPTPTPTPTTATEPPDEEDPEAGADDGDDVDALRQEYLKLRDELFQSRARAAAVASALYSSKITIKLAYGSARFYAVDRASVRLDGASVYDDTEGAIASDDAVRFEGWIAPGRHVIALRVEATGKDDQRFTSATEATFVVEAIAGKDLVVTAKAKDGGDIPYAWSRSEHGSYQLSISADVKTIKRADGGTEKKAKATKTKAAKKAKKSKSAEKGTRRVAGTR